MGMKSNCLIVNLNFIPNIPASISANTDVPKNPNIVFSKEELFEKVWGYDYIGDSATVMVHVNRLREKIEEDSKNPKILETIWGVGYRLNKIV